MTRDWRAFRELEVLMLLAAFRNVSKNNYDMECLESRGIVYWDSQAHGRTGAWAITPGGEKKLNAILRLLSEPLDMSKPYIGVTGFKTIQQVEKVAQWVNNNPGRFQHHQVMIGITASNKRLKDTTSEGKTSPQIGQIKELCQVAQSELLLPMIHYFTDNLYYLSVEVWQIFTKPEFGSLYETGLCRAVQLNHDWPSLQALKTLKEQLPLLKIVMQLSPNVLKLSDEEIIERARNYNEYVDYILIDPSGGQAVSLDLARGVKLLNALRSISPDVCIGAAGGFGVDNISQIITSLSCGEYKDFCVDAQGKLRTDEQLDPDKAIQYLEQAVKAFGNEGKND